MTTWKLLILEAMESRDEKWADIVASTFENGEENVEFDDSYGGEEGIHFTLWTVNFVYFPACYDGS